MAKQTDIEQRLQALEARQNMFFGGPVNLPTNYVDPTTGKTIPLPTVPNMSQSNVTTTPITTTPTTNAANAASAKAKAYESIGDNLVNWTGSTGATPTYDLSGLGIGNIDFSQIPGLAGVYNNANTQTNGDGVVLNVPGSDQDTTKNVTSNVTSNVTQNVTGGDPKLTPADSGDTEKKTFIDIYDPEQQENIRRSISNVGNEAREAGKTVGTVEDLLSAFDRDMYTDEQIYDFLSTSGANVEGSYFNNAFKKLQASMGIGESGENEFGIKGPITDDDDGDESKENETKNTSPKWVEVGRVDNGNGTETVSFEDTNPDSPTYGRVVPQIRKKGDDETTKLPSWTVISDVTNQDTGVRTITYRNDNPASIPPYQPFRTEVIQPDGSTDGDTDGSTGGGTGGGTGGTSRNRGEGIEQRFSDVTGEVNYQAGLTGVDPTLRTGEQVVPTQMQALAGEFENTTGTLLAGSQQAATTGITAEQMKNLEVSGYTDPASAHTMDSIEKAQTQVNALALNAAQTNALTGSVTGQTGTLSNQAIADIGPQTQSIDVKKAEGTFEAPNMQGVTASAVPSANLVETDYNVAAAAAKRNIQTEELATAATLGQNVAQAQAAIQADLNNQALTQAAQTTALENAGINAEAVQQQMADVPLEATVQGQLTNLMAQFAGGQTPAFAAAAIRNAEAQMAARGLSASSMAGAAIMQAAMESSIPIAAQDAQIFREINLTNLNNKQQIALANQAAAQNINLANLNNRQQAALSNSTNAFKLQSDSLSNSQQVALANAQLKAAIQGQELTNAQQTALTNAARYAEVNGINLSNEQQTSLANTSANLQVALSNLSNRQQTALANAQIEAAIKGQELTNAQQAALINTQRIAEINNLKFTEEQTRNLNESQIMQSLTLANLDADMKMALQNAATYAGMDMANLNNRQQAQVLNAQSFLQLDLANLTNKQQGEVLKYQTKAQALFSDQAAINAKDQFNAQSENQSDQFFAQLGASVAQQNSDRIRGMLEFNVNEANAIEKFNTSVADTRDKFNATMQQQINQSNAQWRRQINTVNTAAQNEANRLNALNTLQISQNRLNQLWQQYRDESTWLQQQQFNRDQYIHELAKINLTGDVNRALFNAETKAGAWQAVGDRLVDWIFDDD